MKTRNLDKAINAFISYTVEMARKELSKTRRIRGRTVKRVASGALRKSIYGKVFKSKGATTVAFGAKVKYGKMIEYGVNGTRVNYNSPYSYTGKNINTDWVESWARKKGIKPKDGASINGLKYVIGRSLAKNGIAPVPYMELGLEAGKKKFEDKIFNAYAKDVDKELDKQLK